MSYPLDRFYNINRTFLSIVGLWPYLEKKTKFIRMLCIQLVLICSSIPHFIKLISISSDVDVLLKVLPFSFLFLCITVMYYGELVNTNLIKIIWDRIRYDWDDLTNKQEMNVLERYASISKLYTTVFIAIFYMGEMFIILQTTLPLFLDIVLPLNESRPFQSFIPLELIFDQEKNIIPTLFFLSVSLCNVGAITAATYGSFVVYLHHACGMFRLAGFTLSQAYTETDKMSYTVKENERIYKNLVRSIRIHERAIEFTDFINAVTDKPYILQLFLAIFIVGINILQIFKMKAQREDVSDMMICMLQICGSLLCGYFFIALSQMVIDHSSALFEVAYVTPWHMLCPRTQRLLLMLMKSSLKPCYISIGSMFKGCKELYATFLQTTLSYAMVIYSLQ